LILTQIILNWNQLPNQSMIVLAIV
jgi:hypothetical protein